MSESVGKNRRRKLVIDRPTQMAVVLSLLSAITFTVALLLAALFVVPDRAFFEGLQGDQVRMILIQFLAGFFLIVATAICSYAVIMTHRVAGPEFVLKRAIAGMESGDFSYRTRVRSKDFLQELAIAVGDLSQALEAARSERSRLLAELGNNLDAGELAAAEEALHSLVALESGCRSPDPMPASN